MCKLQRDRPDGVTVGAGEIMDYGGTIGATVL